MYAFVRFLEDDTCCALPVASVRDLRPVHKRDFDEQKVYVVLRGEENGTGQPTKAHILALAGKFASPLLSFYFNTCVDFPDRAILTTQTRNRTALRLGDDIISLKVTVPVW